jgi:hypothetical protein
VSLTLGEGSREVTSFSVVGDSGKKRGLESSIGDVAGAGEGHSNEDGDPSCSGTGGAMNSWVGNCSAGIMTTSGEVEEARTSS